jgi:hypothetical protein
MLPDISSITENKTGIKHKAYPGLHRQTRKVKLAAKTLKVYWKRA